MITSTLQWHNVKDVSPAKAGEYLVASIRDGYQRHVGVISFSNESGWPREYLSNEKGGYMREAEMKVIYWAFLPEHPDLKK